jgi:hypothetical protein
MIAGLRAIGRELSPATLAGYARQADDENAATRLSPRFAVLPGRLGTAERRALPQLDRSADAGATTS